MLALAAAAAQGNAGVDVTSSLLKRMTLQEKFGQMLQVIYNMPEVEALASGAAYGARGGG